MKRRPVEHATGRHQPCNTNHTRKSGEINRKTGLSGVITSCGLTTAGGVAMWLLCFKTLMIRGIRNSKFDQTLGLHFLWNYKVERTL